MGEMKNTLQALGDLIALIITLALIASLWVLLPIVFTN